MSVRNRISMYGTPSAGVSSQDVHSKDDTRPKSMLLPTQAGSHSRPHSLAPVSSAATLKHTDSFRRSSHARTSTQSIGTFAPKFIHTDYRERKDEDRVEGIEGENDFSGKRYVWLPDPENAFIKGWIVDELEDGTVAVETEGGFRHQVDPSTLDRVNPAKFDKADDMAELTYLNEASVIHNLRVRYQSDLIYTYSGLFLVTVNPYRPIPIYGRDYINMYRGRSREEARPHIFAVADEAFRNLVDEGQHQSILVTGESGAGKTENTKKVIQYLAAVATSAPAASLSHSGAAPTTLSQQILQANPILEAFGNAQTVRNNNSSRFGKFIRIEFTRGGQIAGAYIDWYLLEKSRVVKVTSGERNYHIFYQLLRGADVALRRELLLGDLGIGDFEYTRHGNGTISGVSDVDEWTCLLEAFSIIGFSSEEQHSILATVAAVLHLGNVSVGNRGDQAFLTDTAEAQLGRACKLLGVPLEAFSRALLRPKVRAGREIVEKAQSGQQVRLALDALAKGIYERAFGDLVDKVNRSLDRRAAAVPGADADGSSHFIGVLDIAGFEIFEHNSFEQLCINYTNEKLQQFFNHHMFVLEQDEYAREQIEWQFIDFGRDLQPTIDLIELPNPIGIFSCLDEDSVMPKATDATFTDKLHSLWDRKSPQYRRSMLKQGFMLTHYAAEVEYSTVGWLEKNKDPMNDNVTALLAASRNPHVSNLFAECAAPDDDAVRSRVKRGLFRTVAQKHKEQLSLLMGQLHATHPHFVRCILPNAHKRARTFNGPLVLDQLRCNGVLEGIRIARTGFPNRMPFADFRARYGVLASAPGEKPAKLSVDAAEATRVILDRTGLDRAQYRVGLSKVFFRAGVLAELEERRDALISSIVARFQCVARGFTARRAVHKLLYQAEAARIIQKSFRTFQTMQQSPWWTLFVRMRPLLGASRQAKELKLRDEAIKALEEKMQREAEERSRIETERRRAEGEIQKIQQTLEAERALALDKDEIFRRLQAREAELKDRLTDLVAEYQQTEMDIETIANERDAAEQKAEAARVELQEAQIALERLQQDKVVLEEQLGTLSNRVAAAEEALKQSRNAGKELEEELARLRSRMELRERRAAELEARLLEAEQTIDVERASVAKAAAANAAAVKDAAQSAAAEISRLRQQLTELTATTDSFEDLIRQKESELSVARSELAQYAADRAAFDSEKRAMAARHDELQGKLRDAQAQTEATVSQLRRAEADAAECRRLLDNHANAEERQKLLEEQLAATQEELFIANRDLARERQSRDDVEMLSEHNAAILRRDLEAVTQAKVTIEKEMYTQQDILRRAQSARMAAEQDRNETRAELRALREQHLLLQAAKVELETDAERAAAAAAQSRVATLRAELSARDEQLASAAAEKTRMEEQLTGLRRALAEMGSDSFKQRLEEEKERLNRELQLLKGRLAASENDNRALMGRVQQQRLDIARVGGERAERDRVEKDKPSRELVDKLSRTEQQLARLRSELETAQSRAAAAETQKARMQLDIEDLNHRLERSQKAGREAGQQLADAERRLREGTPADDSEGQKAGSLVRSRAAGFDALVKTDRSYNDRESEEREQLIAAYNGAVAEAADLQARLDAEVAVAADAKASLALFKAKADGHLARLEQAEISVLKATRAEQFARAQAKEADETAAAALADRSRLEALAEDLGRRAQQAEARAEDLGADLEAALLAKRRLQHELDDYRSQHALDLEDTATSREQTRQKYQAELAAVSAELAAEREEGVRVREQNSRLRDEMADLRAKWDAESVNSSSWAKEKNRLEVSNSELTRARDEACAARDEAQAKTVVLLGQIRGLRSELDSAISERDAFSQDKKTLSTQLAETTGKLEELARWSESGAIRSAATAEKAMLSLQAKLAAQEDIVSAAVGKMKRAEALAAETQRDIASERETNVQLHKEKATLESTVRELQLRVVDLETKGLVNSGRGDVRFLHGRIQELEKELEHALTDSAASARSSRNIDRTVRDLQTQLDRREQQNAGLEEDLTRARERINKLLETVDELQSSESSSQLSAKRALRELREAKDRIQRLEREIEGWKGLRMERGSLRASSYLGATGMGGVGPVGQLIAQAERESSPGASVVASRALGNRHVRAGSVPLTTGSGSVVGKAIQTLHPGASATTPTTRTPTATAPTPTMARENGHTRTEEFEIEEADEDCDGDKDGKGFL